MVGRVAVRDVNPWVLARCLSQGLLEAFLEHARHLVGELLVRPLQLIDPGILRCQLLFQELLPHLELVGFSVEPLTFSLEKVEGLDLCRKGTLNLGQFLPPSGIQLFNFFPLHFEGTNHLLKANVLDLIVGEEGQQVCIRLFDLVCICFGPLLGLLGHLQ